MKGNVMNNELRNRFDFALIFDVKDGNPNGDPDAGNLPRIDPETGKGLVTDVCLKRKVRNYVQLTKQLQSGYDIFVKEKAILNLLIDKAYSDIEIDLTKAPVDEADGKTRKKTGTGQGKEVDKARAQMCSSYYDIRTFGAVMSTGANAGQVRGPIQMTFARSYDPIVTLEHTITRMAVATEAEAESQSGDNRTMGRNNTVPYGLYVTHGFISPFLAAQTGFTSEDLELFWDSLKNMFEHDRSAARGLMATQKLIVFKHASALGNAHAHKLFETIKVIRNDLNLPPRSFSDYTVEVDKDSVPAEVEVIEMV